LNVRENSGVAIRVTDARLEVRFTRTEKALGLLRDVDVPLSAVRDVDVVPNGLAATRGLRAPGYSWPGSRKLGTWRRPGYRSLVDVRRGQPAVRVGLVGQRYDELLVGSDDAERLAGDIRGRVEG
jgi:hypothetical protein